MTTSKKYLIITVTALLCTAVIFFNRHKSHFGQTFVHAVPVQTAYGWGYNVLAGEKIYIQQEFIPAIPGKHGFKSAEDAMLVGNLVVKKIGEKQWPTITTRDLEELGLIKDTVKH
jgi:Domain of unknown function (DUF4907)